MQGIISTIQTLLDYYKLSPYSLSFNTWHLTGKHFEQEH